MRIRNYLGLLGIALLIALPAQAAKFKVMSKPMDARMLACQKVFKSMGQRLDFNTYGYKSVNITSKKASEPWANTVKQVLWGQYVEGITASRIKSTKTALRKEVDLMFDAAYVDGKTADRVKLTNALYKAAKGRTVFAGGISGAFEAGLSHVTIKKGKEIFSVFAGYSE